MGVLLDAVIRCLLNGQEGQVSVCQSVMLIHAHRPLLTQTNLPMKKEGAMSAHQDCFKCTGWAMFREAATDKQHINLRENAESVSGYICKCTDDVCVTMNITTCVI